MDAKQTHNLTLLFGLTIFMSAGLLFMVQPLFAKILLPHLGGSSSVWVTLMFVYQGLLLLGYGYAHGLSHWLPQKIQIPLHLTLAAVSFYWLPIASKVVLEAPATAMPLGWLIGVALLGIGAPFFILSATSPLLQHWFAHLPHPRRENPYFLYAVSNIGSLGALLAYPFLLERYLLLDWQQTGWLAGYAFFALLLVTTGFVAIKFWHPQPTTPKEADPLASDVAPSLASTPKGRILHWLFLAMVPSSLLLGVTSYITTQITSLPLLWVVPLALYLLTFVVAFSNKPLISKEHSVLLAAFGFGGILLLAATHATFSTVAIFWHLLSFFFITLALHHVLAAKKPAAKKLTSFYFMMSLGGVLGGGYNALVAPLLFESVYEYPLMLLLSAFLLMPYQKRIFNRLYESQTLAKRVALGLDVLLPFVIFALLWLPGKTLKILDYTISFPTFFNTSITLFIVLVILFCSIQRPFRLGFAAALLLLGTVTLHTFNPDHILTKRSFYGTYSIFFNEKNLSYDLISEGSSARQGSQSIEPVKALQTEFFYNFSGLREQLPASLLRKPWASAGLGVGTIACLSPHENKVTFIEIDPLVVHLARESGYFTYLKECPGENTVIVGDGRRMLTDKFDENSLGMVFLDTFSGSAIPTHMLTLEAFDVYLKKLIAEGLIVINITNMHFDLLPLVARQAQALGLTGLYSKYTKRHNSQWVLLARQPEHWGQLHQDPDWHPLPEPPQNLHPWTDSFASLLPLL